jgi:hypothetical protein
MSTDRNSDNNDDNKPILPHHAKTWPGYPTKNLIIPNAAAAVASAQGIREGEEVDEDGEGGKSSLAGRGLFPAPSPPLVRGRASVQMK